MIRHVLPLLLVAALRGDFGASLPTRRRLPEAPLLIGYVSDCDAKAQRAVRSGVNVLIWSFWGIHRRDDDDEYEISSSFSLECVKRIQNELDSKGYDDVVFLASTGGWNGRHLPDKLSPRTLYETWKNWGGHVFHGFDWDLEGNDALQSPYNVFTTKCLNLMGKMSQLAKQDGYHVSMAPPQSYLDFGTSRFSRYVNLTHPMQEWHSDFHYYGANVYAYLLAQYADFIDLVMIQLYESYSRALYEISQRETEPSEYLQALVRDHSARGEGYLVQFEQDPTIGIQSQWVSVPLSKLVIGLANGWAIGSDRTLYVAAVDCAIAYNSWNLTDNRQNRRGVRGFMFWTINAEGKNGINLAEEMNQFLNIRSSIPGQFLPQQ